MHQNTFSLPQKLNKHIMDLVASQNLESRGQTSFVKTTESTNCPSAYRPSAKLISNWKKKGIIVARDRSGYYLNSGITRLPSPASRPRLEMKTHAWANAMTSSRLFFRLSAIQIFSLWELSPRQWNCFPQKTLTRLLTSAPA